MDRQIVLGLELIARKAKNDHRIVELACIEIVAQQMTGNNLHMHFNPNCENDPQAFVTHGIGGEFLLDKPHFKESASMLIEYFLGAELIARNAGEDVTSLEFEFSMSSMPGSLCEICDISDILNLARRHFPNRHINLDALHKCLGMNGRHHCARGALASAEITAELYLALTAAQSRLTWDWNEFIGSGVGADVMQTSVSADFPELPIDQDKNVESMVLDDLLIALSDAANNCFWDGIAMSEKGENAKKYGTNKKWY